MKFKKFLALKSTNYDKIDRFFMFKMFEKYKSNFKLPFIIQIIGTNGKGSTGRFLAQLLENLGLKIGHFTSPHIFSFNERFYTNKNIISDEELEKTHEILHEIFGSDFEKLSYFEYATFLALKMFEKSDFLILEAGVGGEYDATSVFGANMSIFTKISYDHMQILGNSLEQIARTKLKTMTKLALISDEQEQSVLSLAQKIAILKGSDLRISTLNPYLQDEFENYTFNFKLPNFLRHNLKLALNACEILQGKEKSLQALKSLKALNLQGRCQKINENLFVDVGHNALAASALCESFKNEKINLIYNSYLDKDVYEILKTLKPIIDTIQIYKYENLERKLANDEIFNIASSLGVKCEHFKSLNLQKKNLVFGSFVLVENFLRNWCDKK